MALTTCSVTTSVIASLGTTPDERGLTTDQFKAKFDEFGANFVAWFNDTHLPESECPASRITNSVNQTLATGGDTVLNFNTEIIDTGGMHDNVTNNSRLTCIAAGIYLINANIQFSSNATGYREIYFKLNDTIIIAASLLPAVATTNTVCCLSAIYSLSESDYVELHAIQNSGGDIAVTKNNNYSPIFSMVRIA
jgi:hypothetical protein